MIPNSEKFPPLWEEMGFVQVAPHVFRSKERPNAGGILSAEKTWSHLRGNLRRLRRTP